MSLTAGRWLLLAAVAAGLALLLAGVWLVRHGAAQRALQPDAVQAYKRIGDESLALHLFRPPGGPAPGLRPALLLFHGGGWQLGNAAQFHSHCRHWSRLGVVCVSATYRTASVHGTTPADALQDARDAMRHLRRHGAALGIDPARIAAGGGSAGGQLAAALATGVPLPDPGADPQAPVRPDALLLFNPMLDLAPGMPDHDRVGAAWSQLSPLQQVGPGMPPTLLLGGDADAEVAVATLQAFCGAVQAHGGQCAVQVLAGAGHGFFNPGAQGGRFVAEALAHAERFLTAWMAAPASR